jgi:2-C-methyl-D-erythritol 4-phosphate cytidylyltransferase
MRGAVTDKVLAPLAGRTVLEYSLRAFLDSGIVEHFMFVVRDAEQQAAIAAALSPLHLPAGSTFFATGGRERQDSVYNGLHELSLLVDNVFIHDCARPLVTPDNLRTLLDVVVRDRATVLAHRVTDTIKQAPIRKRGGLRRLRLRDLRRDTLWAMETPQVFSRELIIEAYRQLRLEDLRVTDDAAAVAHLGHAVTLVENSTPNPKLTHPEDFAFVELLLQRRSAPPALAPNS